ncbi:hypothetical protein HAZT_HAZT009934 [Hyalella azteca]|uniref:BING4 C-terminal domain-containing protein n=1 Tax=Hyalella azteca TaxID=294128 RepID=A0A6A0GY06_HYAAZ|nr:hypothetical protein HAZT_HAZT009934 [Hyalella azteca]
MRRNSQREAREKFPDRRPIDPELLKKYNYGHGMSKYPNLARDKFRAIKIKQREVLIQQSRKDTARAEVLLTEQPGCIEVAPGASTTEVTQKNILQAADITTKKKSFSLQLDSFGPYCSFQYFRDGRHLALAGQLGHLATFNWLTKKLTMELNAMESLHDVVWLQDTSAIAVAQKKWMSIYDDRGTELHVVKRFYDITKLDYLPYHFLLTGLSGQGNLHYLDVSLGKEVILIQPKQPRAVAMVNSPFNGVMATAHSGLVCMWTPNYNEPVASMLCHKSNISALTYDPAGRYLLTAAYDRKVNIWDARNLGSQLQSLSMPHSVVSSMSVSQTGLVALACGRDVNIYKGLKEGNLTPYLHHPLETKVHQVQFCPYEDVLGVTSRSGFSSLIVPGAGEANFDAYEANPFSNRTTRRETLVKNLLEKIPYEHITLDPRTVTQVDVPSLEEKMEEKRRLIYMKVPKIDPNPRYRMKGKSGSAQTARRKLIKREVHKKRYIDRLKRAREGAGIDDDNDDDDTSADTSDTKHAIKRPTNIIDVFKKRK